jgi:MFS superfamily sulfate permease-like transporter
MGVILSIFAAIWRLVFGQKKPVQMTNESVVLEEFVEDVVAKVSDVPVGQYVILQLQPFFFCELSHILNRICSQQTRNELLHSITLIC